MEIQIRKATTQDTEDIKKLHVSLHADNKQYDTYLDLTWPTDERGAEYFQDVLTNHDCVTFIAHDSETAVGYIAGGKKDITYRTVKMAEIYSMCVAPEYQSQGIGEKLIHTFTDWARSSGYNRLYVNVYFSNERGIAFYKRCGLQPIDLSLEAEI